MVAPTITTPIHNRQKVNTGPDTVAPATITGPVLNNTTPKTTAVTGLRRARARTRGNRPCRHRAGADRAWDHGSVVVVWEHGSSAG